MYGLWDCNVQDYSILHDISIIRTVRQLIYLSVLAVDFTNVGFSGQDPLKHGQSKGGDGYEANTS
jgi:hypothetical protein